MVTEMKIKYPNLKCQKCGASKESEFDPMRCDVCGAWMVR
jgi:Zn finger protein HypA/HybF involved in hydrogenase expression